MMKQIKQSDQNRISGFTLLEVLIAVTLMAIIMASITSTFIVFASGSQSVGAYVEMSQDSRKSLEIFSRDVRTAADITYATENAILVKYPDNSFYDGRYVKYIYEADSKTYSRMEFEEDVDLKANGDIDELDGDLDSNTISNELMLAGVEQFEFNFYDPLGVDLDAATPSLLLSIKSIQIDAKMQRKISQTSATDYIISARFMMRNRALTL